MLSSSTETRREEADDGRGARSAAALRDPGSRPPRGRDAARVPSHGRTDAGRGYAAEGLSPRPGRGVRRALQARSARAGTARASPTVVTPRPFRTKDFDLS